MPDGGGVGVGLVGWGVGVAGLGGGLVVAGWVRSRGVAREKRELGVCFVWCYYAVYLFSPT